MNRSHNDTVSSLPSIITQDHYDYLMKIITIGSSSTGKTCLLHRFVKDHFIKSSQTIGVEFSSKVLQLDSCSVKLQLWDTAGQERFRSLTRSYYRGSAGVVLVFDLSDRSTLWGLKDFVMDVRALCYDPVLILVGNKLDLVGEIDPTALVRDDEVKEFMKQMELENVKYIMTSAKQGMNISKIFESLSDSIVTKVELGILDPELPISGVQYGDVPWNTTITTSMRSKGPLRRKSTTLSLIDRSIDDKRPCNC